MRHFFPFIAVLLFTIDSSAFTWHVGATQSYTMPSQVSTLVQDGDTVEIDAGVYPMDVAKWTANNLVLKGVNGMAQLPSGGLTYGGKAIWVITGNNTTVEYIDFSEAACVDMNGAGIRQEGANLIVRHCKFHDNENGILANTVNPSNILIEYSEFANNGAGDGYSHNLYINHIDTLIFRYNYSHGASVGHELKSRANVNFIMYNRISNETTGTASRNIDLPNGGTTYIIGNIIEQGPESENSNIIGYGLEGFTNPSPNELYAINNTIVNNLGGSFFHLAATTSLFKAYNNIIAGNGSFIYGTPPPNIDTASNVISTNVNSYNFYNASAYDYNLTDTSFLVLNNGTDPGMANGFLLTPTLQYVHPNSSASRCISGQIDVGAFELCEIATAINPVNRTKTFYPNPAGNLIQFRSIQNNVTVTNIFGIVMLEADNVSTMNINDLVTGLYYVRTQTGVQPLMICR